MATREQENKKTIPILLNQRRATLTFGFNNLTMAELERHVYVLFYQKN